MAIDRHLCRAPQRCVRELQLDADAARRGCLKIVRVLALMNCRQVSYDRKHSHGFDAYFAVSDFRRIGGHLERGLRNRNFPGLAFDFVDPWSPILVCSWAPEQVGALRFGLAAEELEFHRPFRGNHAAVGPLHRAVKRYRRRGFRRRVVRRNLDAQPSRAGRVKARRVDPAGNRQNRPVGLLEESQRCLVE